jgi:hypothetical protein
MSAVLVARQTLEVADVIRVHGTEFLSRHGAWLSPEQ